VSSTIDYRLKRLIERFGHRPIASPKGEGWYPFDCELQTPTGLEIRPSVAGSDALNCRCMSRLPVS
jgi:hypothetical protein